ncbi:hypothetical protein FHG87_008824 [Trinorchestia longiramus]|nr:hypothetical protein FHG87_008824 [Trinorchestia longiramus]
MFAKLLLALALVVAALAMPRPDDDFFRWGAPSFRSYAPVSFQPVRRVVYSAPRRVFTPTIVRSFGGYFGGDDDFYHDD